MLDNAQGMYVYGNGSLSRGRDMGREGREREGGSEGCIRQFLYFRDSRADDIKFPRLLQQAMCLKGNWKYITCRDLLNLLDVLPHCERVSCITLHNLPPVSRGCLTEGLLQVNGQSVIGMPHNRAVALIRRARGHVNITVSRWVVSRYDRGGWSLDTIEVGGL